MSSFKFKSAGTKVTAREVSTDQITKKRVDIGIKTPLANNQDRQIFDMHTEIDAQLKDNLRNLIMTNAGERLGLYNFGADLSTLLFDLTSSESVESEIIDRIAKAVDNFMPGIEIQEVLSVELDRAEKDEVNRKGMAKVRLRIIYNVPSARIQNQALDVTLQNGG